MFTGLIQTVGTVIAAEGDPGRRVVVRPDAPLAISVGSSVACAGICLTAEEINDGTFSVSVTAQTLRQTAAGDWASGTRINLEPSLRVGDELGGHFVSGHVDGIAVVESVVEEGSSRRIHLTADGMAAHSGKTIAPGGSVTLDGVSLTVNEAPESEGESSRFAVTLIPHTLAETTWGQASAGHRSNMEIDLLTRYVARLLDGE